MIFLISGIIAIGLFAMLMVAGSGTLSTDSIVRRETAHVVESSISNIGNAFQAYRIANNGARPSTANWKAEMADYAPSRSAEQMARPVRGMSWSYGVGANRSWFCLHGDQPSKAVIQGLSTVARHAAAGKATIAQSCPTSGGARAENESQCSAGESGPLCDGLAVEGSDSRALILYPQG